MTQQTPVPLEYQSHRPPQVRRFAAAALVCWIGLLTLLAGIVVVVAAANARPAAQFIQLGVTLACFGGTWWILGLILREAMRR